MRACVYVCVRAFSGFRARVRVCACDFGVSARACVCARAFSGFPRVRVRVRVFSGFPRARVCARVFSGFPRVRVRVRVFSGRAVFLVLRAARQHFPFWVVKQILFILVNYTKLN